VRATDGNGNTASRTIGYTVRATWRPDAMLRRAGGSFVGNNVYAQDAAQTLRFVTRSRSTQYAMARLQNEGLATDTLRITGSAGTTRFPVRYYRGSVDVTARVVAGTFTVRLAPGSVYDLKIAMGRRGAYAAGVTRSFYLRAVSAGSSGRHDRVIAVRG
jgi:hypothetical protein